MRNQQRAVKSDPGPAWGGPCEGIFSPGSELNGFLFAPTVTVLRTLARAPRVAARKESLYTVCRKARGQFPNNPCDWSNAQVEGRSASWHEHAQQGGDTFPFYSTTQWGRGVFG